MNKAKVQLFGQGRSVTINPDATNGATVGSNLRWGDGSLILEAEIRNALAAQSAGISLTTASSLFVPVTREVNTSAPLAGGGALDSDLTLSHANSGVVAGTYESPTLTINATGHVTSATAGSGGQTPTLVASGETFTVQANKQVLFKQTIVVEGALVVNGALIGV